MHLFAVILAGEDHSMFISNCTANSVVAMLGDIGMSDDDLDNMRQRLECVLVGEPILFAEEKQDNTPGEPEILHTQIIIYRQAGILDRCDGTTPVIVATPGERLDDALPHAPFPLN